MKSFLDLPDELILKVFSYTERTDHWRCGRVSKRIRNISKDNLLIPKRNLMDLLPGEIILKVLSYTEIADILSCGQVSKRFRDISNDHSLLSTSQLLKKIHAPYVPVKVSRELEPHLSIVPNNESQQKIYLYSICHKILIHIQRYHQMVGFQLTLFQPSRQIMPTLLQIAPPPGFQKNTYLLQPTGICKSVNT